MKRSKLLFFIMAIMFFIILAIIAFDMAKRTTAPWKKNPPAAAEQSS